MSKEKELFLKYVGNMLGLTEDYEFSDGEIDLVRDYYLKFKEGGGGDASKPAFTEKGIVILKYLKENPEAVLPAKKIAEDLELSSRTVSGAMKKLVNDGYVEKFEGEPKTYSITEKGKEVDFAE